jgi:AraC family transcriptional regulator
MSFPRTPKREALLRACGMQITKYQDASDRFDDAAAAALVLDRTDLPILTILLFEGAQAIDDVAPRLGRSRSALRATVARLEHAGYIGRVPGARGSIELTALARTWIDTIWGPLEREGQRVLDTFPSSQLVLFAQFLDTARAVQEQHLARVRALIEAPRPPKRRRGGLSPAALRRVELFVEANLEHPIRLEELARRAGLSKFHFAHAFKASVGITPRAFAESRRIERAKQLLRESSSTLSAIALATGFGTQSRFTTVFRRATGMTPAAFRKLAS